MIGTKARADAHNPTDAAGRAWRATNHPAEKTPDRRETLRLPPAPDHWTTSWLDRRHRPGEYDCVDFVAEILAARFQIKFTPPQRAAGLRGRDRQAAALKTILAEPTAAPVEGDGVLMRGFGRKGEVGNHVGVYAAPGGRGSVLHLMAGSGARLHRLDALKTAALEIEGFYRWRPQPEAL